MLRLLTDHTRDAIRIYWLVS
ncbi:hypothetical protein VN97_g12561, partial [Penicillium thymicola]